MLAFFTWRLAKAARNEARAAGAEAKATAALASGAEEDRRLAHRPYLVATETNYAPWGVPQRKSP